jgi:hypothetical protein
MNSLYLVCFVEWICAEFYEIIKNKRKLKKKYYGLLHMFCIGIFPILSNFKNQPLPFIVLNFIKAHSSQKPISTDIGSSYTQTSFPGFFDPQVQGQHSL